MSPDINPQNSEIYQQCIKAVSILLSGNASMFAKTAAEVYDQIRSLVITECEKLGYLDAAMQVYDGRALWH